MTPQEVEMNHCGKTGDGAIGEILAFTPPETGRLDREATHRSEPSRQADLNRDELAGVEVTPDYEKALALIDAKVPLVFVTGQAGTGKSTFIQFLRRAIPEGVALVAPTGVAALNVGGVTIHSFFRFPPRVLHPDDIKRLTDNRLYKRINMLIVDEVSMVRADVIDAMDRFLRVNGPDPDRPFGGVQVVMVGDLAQLPPVVSTEEESALFSRRYRSPFFFSAHALSCNLLAPVELGRVFRQEDGSFVDLLSKIRLGDVDEETLNAINQRVGTPLPHPEPVILVPTNAAADAINVRALAQLPDEERTFVGRIEGSFKLETGKLPAPLRLKLKEGARVMSTKNAPGQKWVNGTLGTVLEFKPGKITVEIEDRGRGVVDVGPDTWEQYRYRYDQWNERVIAETTGSYTQFPLQPAWAVTIHKAQGQTLPAVHIDLGRGAFAPGQTYVALSRARGLDAIWLSNPVRRRDIFCDERIAAFYRGLFRGAVNSFSE